MCNLLLRLLVVSTSITSCLGERCSWKTESFCQNCTREDTPDNRLSYDGNLKESVQLRCSKSKGHVVVLCEHPGLTGECHTTHIPKGQDCTNVDPKINKLASSIHLLTECIRVYDEANCEGKSLLLDKGKGVFKLTEMNDMVTSVGLCSKTNRSKREDNAASPTKIPKFRAPYVVCYLSNNAFKNAGPGKFTPEDVDPQLCTHINYYAGFLKNHLLTEKDTDEPEQYKATVALKEQNSNLKILLTVVSEGSDTQPFKELTSNEARIKQFVSETIKFLRRYRFDGLNVYWDYPSGKADKIAYVSLMKELRQAFEKESETSGETRLILTVSDSGKIGNTNEGFAVPEISKYLDFINVEAFGMLDVLRMWRSVSHHSPLYSPEGTTGSQMTLTLNYQAQEWVKKGAPKEKLVIGMPTFGTSFTLADPTKFAIGDRASGQGTPGQYTSTPGYMSYYEICDFLSDKNTSVVWDDERQVPFAHNRDQWVGFDNERSLEGKVAWLKQEGYGGIVVTSIDWDDFRGTCGSGTFPLLNAIRNELNDYRVELKYDGPFDSHNLTEQYTPISLRAHHVFCTINSGAWKLADAEKFTPDKTDKRLCTHIVYSHATLNNQHLINEGEAEEYKATVALKEKTPNLKVLISIGGEKFGSKHFKGLTSNMFKMNRFTYSAVHFLRKYKFDGLMVDWRYPSGTADRDAYVNLLKGLRQAFEGEADFSKKPRLFLTASVTAHSEDIDTGYDVPEISKYLDFFNVLTFGLHQYWDGPVVHHSPLYPPKGASSYQKKLTVDYSARAWDEKGASKEKLIIGMPTFGVTFTLKDPEKFDIGAPVSGNGTAGKYTSTPGSLSYYEICDFLRDKKTSLIWDNEQQVPFAHRGDQWVGFDNEKSLRRKKSIPSKLQPEKPRLLGGSLKNNMKINERNTNNHFKLEMAWLKEEGYGGIMVWTIDEDDFGGTCGSGKFPLLKAMRNELKSNRNTTKHGSPVTPKPPKPQIVTEETQPVPQGESQTLENCILSKTFVNGKRVCKNSVIFFDDFHKFDSEKWGHEIKIARKPDYEFTVYNDKPENIYLKSGTLHLKPTVNTKQFVEAGNLNLDRCTGDAFDNECSRNTEFFILPPVQSARISTQQKLNFKYGLVEVQAKFLAGDWLAADIRLVPADYTYGPQYESGLIRMISRGNLSLKKSNGEEMGINTVEGTVMLGYGPNVKAKSVYYRRDHGWQNEFHNFTILWTPEDIAFFVDGNERKNVMRYSQGSRLTDVIGLPSTENQIWSTGTSIAPFDQPFYLSLGVSAGGIWDFQDGWDSNGKPRPWSNTSPRAMLSFWKKKDEWQRTWETNSAFQIKSVKIVAL